MADALSICNLGLGKISASSITSLAPPRSVLEKHCAQGYPTWRDNELQKRTWYFALNTKTLTLADTITDSLGDGRIYKFAVPTDNLKLIRDKYTEWQQRGLYIFSSQATLTLPYVRRASEGEFDSLFVELLACRVGQESTELATQSENKGESINTKYKRALNDAARANAFIIGPEDISLADENSEWVTARW